MDLKQTTDESTKYGALDAVADYYLKMAGGTVAIPTGKIEEFMYLAKEQGDVQAFEIAEIFDTDKHWLVGSQM